jgi:succinyl-CoA synthetase beta subunit
LLIVPEAVAAAKQLTTETGTSWYVVKPKFMQVDVERWWSKLAKNLQQVEEISEQIIGMQLITPQTSAEGKSTQSFNC